MVCPHYAKHILLQRRSDFILMFNLQDFITTQSLLDFVIVKKFTVQIHIILQYFPDFRIPKNTFFVRAHLVFLLIKNTCQSHLDRVSLDTSRSANRLLHCCCLSWADMTCWWSSFLDDHDHGYNNSWKWSWCLYFHSSDTLVPDPDFQSNAPSKKLHKWSHSSYQQYCSRLSKPNLRTLLAFTFNWSILVTLLFKFRAIKLSSKGVVYLITGPSQDHCTIWTQCLYM